MRAATRVRLDGPSRRREDDYLAAVRRSRSLHRGFVTTASTPEEYRDYLRRARRKNQESFFVVIDDLDELAGVVNVNEIVRYSEQSGRLGYYAFAPHAGSGFMREGLALVIDRAFGELGLHRLEASVQRANRRSTALVRTLGFRREGVARGCLKVGGRWRDHDRWALLRNDWRATKRRRRGDRSG
jgi:ribosomal-protein-alanine N-acetyltransferase